ncbi:MAG: discoidin domain-containing protein [Chloroflexota bacterium]
MKSTLRLIIIGVIVALAVVAFAQDSTTPAEPLSEEDTLALLSDTGVNIFPLDVIIDNPPILVGLNATSTTIELITNIPTNCLVLFGTTPDFGRASQDANMADLFTEDHLPFLGNLEPETTYYYRLQGSDANGNFYVSEIFTFTTPAESNEISDNLLSPSRDAEIIAVSSNFNDGANDSRFGIDNAFDDNPNTAWSSNGDGDDAFVEVALGQRSQINSLRFWTRTMSNNTSQIFSFTVTTDTGDVYGPFELPDPDQAYDFAVDFVAETLRFDAVETNGGNTGAVEIAVFGEPLDE